MHWGTGPSGRTSTPSPSSSHGFGYGGGQNTMLHRGTSKRQPLVASRSGRRRAEASRYRAGRARRKSSPQFITPAARLRFDDGSSTPSTGVLAKIQVGFTL